MECPVAASHRNLPFANLYVDAVHSISDSSEPGPKLSDDDRIPASVLVWIADLQVQLRAQHERQLHLLVRVLYPDGTHSSDGGFRCLLSGQKGGLPDSVGISPSVHSFRHRNCCGFDQFLSSKSVFLSSGSGKSVSGLHLWTGVLLRHRLDSGGSDTVFCNFISKETQK